MSNKKIFKISDIDLFKGIPEDIIDSFIKEAPHAERNYNKGDIIAIRGDSCKSLYLLTSGKVCTQMDDGNGKFLTIEQIVAPNVLAPAFLFSTTNKFPVNIVAKSECKIFVFSKEYYKVFMHKEEIAMINFIKSISDKAVFLSEKISEFALKDLTARIISYLNTYEEISNQQFVATKLGVTRPALARTISKLIDEGILKRDSLSSTIRLSKKNIK